MPVEVPAHVYQQPQIQNQVQVQPGTNWDFSRTALETPIVALPDPVVRHPLVATPAPAPARYVAGDGLPGTRPILSLTFAANTATIPRDQQATLRALARDASWTVVAHADAGESDAERLARARARAVTSLLRHSGHTVDVVKALGDSRPVPGAADSADNRTVDLYLVASTRT